MKTFLHFLLSVLVTLLATSVATAQAPPGWGWVNQLGTFVPNASERNDVAGLGRDAAGNLYLLGNYVGSPALSGMPTTNGGQSDIFLAKYSPAGALLWLRTLQGTGVESAVALVVEPSGRCTLAGSFGGGTTGGNLIFTGFGTAFELSGPAFLGLPTTGGYYGSLYFVAAIDASGTFLWADVPSPVYGLSGATALHRDSSGNCYVSVNPQPQGLLTVDGVNYPSIGSIDAVLIKYTTAGQHAWVRRVGASSGFTYSGSVKTDATDALYWTVNHSRSFLLDGQSIPAVTAANPVTQGSNTLIKIDASNRVRWAKNGLLKSGSTNAQGEVVAIDRLTNTMYLSGNSYNGTIADQTGAFSLPVPAGSYGNYIAKCDTSGTVQWLRPFAYASVVPSGAGWAATGLTDFFPDASGYTAVTNTAYLAQTVFPPAATFDLSKSGLPCVVRYTYATNQFEWIRTGGLASTANTSLGSRAIASAVDASGNVFVAGTFRGIAQFGATTITSTTPAQPEIFLAKLDQTILAAGKVTKAGQAWSVFPNPSTGTAQLVGLPGPACVRVLDALGRVVLELPTASSPDTPRTVTGLRPGLYLLQVTNTNAQYQSQRLVVQ